MKLDRKVRYAANIIIVLCVYALLFELCKWDEKYDPSFDFLGQSGDIKKLLCVISGVPLTELLMELPMTKWMLAVSVIFILVGREVYYQQNNLKYIAMIRYKSYRRFYLSLMNRTVVNVLLYGSSGVLTTYVLYTCEGNGQVRDKEFLEIGTIYLSQLLLLCLLQTLCMIWTQGYTASVMLLIFWFAMVMFGHWIMKSSWIWLPANWGMYVRGAKEVYGGVTNTAYYVQAGICFLLWIGVPFIIQIYRNFRFLWVKREQRGTKFTL